MSVCFSLGKNFSSLLGEGIESVHDGFVGKRVLLSLVVSSHVLSDASQLGLNLVRVDDSSDVSTSHKRSVQLVTILLKRISLVSPEDVVESLECILGEDQESAEVSSGGELENVESSDVASVDSRQVSSCLLDGLRLISINDKRALSHHIS